MLSSSAIGNWALTCAAETPLNMFSKNIELLLRKQNHHTIM